MKLLRKEIDTVGAGDVTLLPSCSEDLWHTYNVLRSGDRLCAITFRRVQKESDSGIASEKKKIRLTVEVLDLDYDPGDETIRVAGKNISENKFVKMGAHHTIELALNRKFTITKAYWDSIALERVEEACNPALTADVGAVLLQDGLANICLVTPSMTLVKAKVDMTIPRKRKGASGHDKAIVKFYERVLEGVLSSFDFDVIKVVLVASPGFVKDQFYEYMMAEAVRRDIKAIKENRNVFMLCHSAGGHKGCLSDVMGDAAVAERLQDTKAAGEVQALNKFYEMLRDDPDRAFYGYKHVTVANENKAIDTLLVTDSLFRSKNLREREQYVALVESVKENGGDVRIFSMLHVSGEQLAQVTGVAAILRYPLPDIEDLELFSSEEEEEEEEEEERDYEA